MRPIRKRGLVIGVAFVIGVLLANAGVAFRQAARMHEDSFWVAHTHEVLAGLSQLLSSIKDAETGVRGFLITGEPRFLAPYESVHGHIDSSIDQLASLTADNPVQQAQFPRSRSARRRKWPTWRKPLPRNDSVCWPRPTRLRKWTGQTGDRFDPRLWARCKSMAAGAWRVDRQKVSDGADQSALASSVLAAVLGLVAVGAFRLAVAHTPGVGRQIGRRRV